MPDHASPTADLSAAALSAAVQSAASSPFDPAALAHPDEARTLIDLLLAAEPIAKQFFRQPLSVETKADASPVTQADKGIEAAMRRILAARHGAHGVFGEEEGASGPDDRLWVIDPIDGTKAFMHGNPLYGHLVAWCVDGAPVLGGIGLSAMNEMIVAAKGAGAWIGRPGAWRRARARSTTTLAEAALLSTSPTMFEGARLEQFKRLAAAARYVRYGGDCFNYASLAAGWTDLCAENQLQPYDILALAPVVTEAGGVITTWSGAPIAVGATESALAAATPELHRAALERLG